MRIIRKRRYWSIISVLQQEKATPQEFVHSCSLVSALLVATELERSLLLTKLLSSETRVLQPCSLNTWAQILIKLVSDHCLKQACQHIFSKQPKCKIQSMPLRR